MTYTLKILSAADVESADTITWLLEHTSPEHVAAYVAAISSGLDEIVASPFAWARWKSLRDVRVHHLREISYSIIYQVRGRVVLVVAFAHMSRAPGYWLDRLT